MILLLLLSTVGILADLLAIGEWAAHYEKRRAWVVFSLLVSVLAFGTAAVLAYQKDASDKEIREKLQATVDASNAELHGTKTKLDQTSAELHETKIKLDETAAELQHLNAGIRELAKEATNQFTVVSVRELLAYLSAPPEQQAGMLPRLLARSIRPDAPGESRTTTEEPPRTNEAARPNEQAAQTGQTTQAPGIGAPIPAPLLQTPVSGTTPPRPDPSAPPVGPTNALPGPINLRVVASPK